MLRLPGRMCRVHFETFTDMCLCVSSYCLFLWGALVVTVIGPVRGWARSVVCGAHHRTFGASSCTSMQATPHQCVLRTTQKGE
jgi:heme exporter protein D